MVAPHALPAPSADDPFHSEQAKTIIEYLKKNGDPTMKVSWQQKWSHEMATVHTFLIEMFSRVYAYAEYAVEINDVANYLGYAEIAIYQICSHHEFEETAIFPALEKATGSTSFGINITQHHTFHTQLEVTWAYLRKVRAALKVGGSPVPAPSAAVDALDIKALSGLDPAAPFDPKGLREYMKTYVPALLEHLKDEIPTLTPEVMEKAGEKQLQVIDAMVRKHLMSYDPAWFLCSAYACVPVQLVKDAVPVPYIVRRLLIPFLWAPKYKGFWLYCPYPENLTFAGTA